MLSSLGKGKPIQFHPGNIRMRTWVDTYLEDYRQCPSGEKQMVAEKVVAAMTSQPDRPCRFLKRNKEGWWIPVPNKEAVAKVLKSLRTTQSTRGAQTVFLEHHNKKRARVIENENAGGCFASFFCGAS